MFRSDIVISGSNEQLLAYLGYKSECIVYDLVSDKVLCSFQSKYAIGGTRAFIDDESKRIYIASFSPSMLYTHCLLSGKLLASVKLNRRLDAIMHVGQDVVHASSHPSIVAGSALDGVLSRRLSGGSCSFSYEQTAPFLIKNGNKERLLLLDETFEVIGKPITIECRGAVQLDGMTAIAWKIGPRTEFFELNFETGNIRELFIMEQSLNYVFAYYDRILRHIHLLIYLKSEESRHVRIDVNNYDRVVMRNGVDRLGGSLHVRRLNRLYSCYGDVYDLSTAEYLKPVALNS
jgi:hypothetical protein